MKKLLLLFLAVLSVRAQDATDDYYAGELGRKVQSALSPISMNDANQCHRQFYLNEAFVQHSENDMSRQIYQMNIDQRNFAQHFVLNKFVNGLKDELTNIQKTYNQAQVEALQYNELVFLTQKYADMAEIEARVSISNSKADFNVK